MSVRCPYVGIKSSLTYNVNVTPPIKSKEVGGGVFVKKMEQVEHLKRRIYLCLWELQYCSSE